jgi:hypothetical protein
MLLNPFQPMITGAPLAVTGAAQNATITYDTKQLCTYLLTNVGTQTVFVLFGTSPTVTVNNGFPVLANSQSTFTGPPNATVQAIAAAVGSTLYVSAGEGM